MCGAGRQDAAAPQSPASPRIRLQSAKLGTIPSHIPPQASPLRGITRAEKPFNLALIRKPIEVINYVCDYIRLNLIVLSSNEM